MKRVIVLLISILIIVMLAVSIYILIDRQSVVPKEIKSQCTVKQEEYMKRKIFILEPKDEQQTNKKILYFHGGSYTAQASQHHWEFISKLVQDTKTTVIMLDYPLTPKYDYEDVFNIVEPFYKELINKVDPNNLIMMGDSAGGGLSLALEEKLASQNIMLPSKTILISPWLDVRLENPQIEEVQKRDKHLNKETLKLAGITYSKGDVNNYLVSPIEGDLFKLKDITILIGTEDILNPDVKLLKKKADEQGIRRANTSKRI